MLIFTGCIPESPAFLVILDEGDGYRMRVWNCTQMFAVTGEGAMHSPFLDILLMRARFCGFVLEEV